MSSTGSADAGRVTFAEQLSEVAAAALRRAGGSRRYQAGATLLFEGDAPAEVMLLRVGRVKVVAAGLDGTESLLGLRGPGELVGEFTALLAGRRSATVIAIDDVDV
nr:cyclic nucleotide-binding domain-containing protein [Micromonospora sp. DSM 115978]